MDSDVRFLMCKSFEQSPQSESYRYAFDVIGELYFGKKFGFMEERADYGTYMESVWNLVSVLAWISMLPSFAQKAVLAGGFVIPSVRRGMTVMLNMINIAKERVAERLRDIIEGKPTRQDLLGKTLAIHQESGEKDNFLLEDAEVESYTALYKLHIYSAYDRTSDRI